MKTLAICITPAVLLVAFAVAFVHAFRPTTTTTDEGE